MELHFNEKTPIAKLFKGSRKWVFSLTHDGSNWRFQGENGLRFDSFSKGETFEGLLTHDLWARSLKFQKVGSHWKAEVPKAQIIDTDYEVYLAISMMPDGTLNAKIQSNRENRKLHFVIRNVTLSGNRIDFELSDERFSLGAELDPGSGQLLLHYGNPGGSRTVKLKKMGKEKIAGYWPTVPGQKYVYKVPSSSNIGMKVSHFEDVGIKPSLLKIIPAMVSGAFDHITSILITRDQKLVFEEYFHGTGRDDLQNIRSGFKSIASLLVGKAMEEHPTLSVKRRLLDFYPEYGISHNEKRAINLEHALTMSTGLKLEDEDRMQWQSDDWVKYKLELPLVHPPGSRFEYSSGGANLLSGVVTGVTKQYLPLFFYENLCIPLEIERIQMRTSPMGRGYLAGDFWMRPVDFTKFGLLILSEGTWNGRQVVSKAWIQQATQPHIKGSWPKDSDYGYLWRILQRQVGGQPMQTIEAWVVSRIFRTFQKSKFSRLVLLVAVRSRMGMHRSKFKTIPMARRTATAKPALVILLPTVPPSLSSGPYPYIALHPSDFLQHASA